jgi:hypothetical protein
MNEAMAAAAFAALCFTRGDVVTACECAPSPS